MPKDKLNNLWRILLFLIPISSVTALFASGFYDPHDMHHLADIYEMYRAIISGQFPPRLGPDFSFGYTYPLFNYYYLLPFYMGALFYAIFGSLAISFKMVLLISMYLSFYGMYNLLRIHFNKASSLLGAALFIYTPYRAVQIYVRGSLGEILALSLLPWVLFLTAKYILKPNHKIFSLYAFVFFLFVISHNYFFALSLPIIALYSVVISKDYAKPLKRILGLGLSLFLGIFSASFWIIPALFEKNLVREETPFPLLDHFPFVKQLILPSWGYGASVWGSGDEISFQVGLLNLIVIVVFSIYIVWGYVIKKIKNQNLWLSLFIVFGFIVSLVFMNIRTYPIWKIIPFHDLIQFPWRLLNFTTLFSSIALAAIVNILKPKLQTKLLILGLLSMLAISVSYFHPKQYFQKSDSEYLELFFNNSSYSEDYLLLPKWVEKRPKGPANSVFESSSIQNIKESDVGLVHWRAEIESISGGEIIINKYYFPGWQVILNGQSVKIDKIGEFGKIVFNVPAGKHKIEVFWQETKLRKTANLLSLLSFLIMILIYKYPKLIKFK